MGYSSSTLENSCRILTDFNRASIVSLGNVVLPVQADLVILNVRFSVIEDLSPYNAFMGWVWLYKMKVIPSTYYQMVNYLTKAGQVDLHGSQLATRQYYQVTVETRQKDPTEDESKSSYVRDH